jgi:hypothetical protein
VAGEDLRSSPATFILGLSERTGTNYLVDLLCVHPAYVQVSPVYEDDLLRRADLLAAYARSTVERWRQFPVAADAEARLLKSIGDGLLAQLTDLAVTGPLARPDATRLVTKTPSVQHVDLFPKLFPDSHLLVLIRDGRAVVQSAVQGFGWDFDETARMWAERVRELQRFLTSEAATGSRVLLVRFEELCRDLEPAVTRVLDFVGLGTADYRFDAAQRLPVRGSSVVGLVDGNVQWDRPVDPGAGFDPTARWRDWDEAKLNRFDWLAGEELEGLGYERGTRAAATPARVAAEFAWRARSTARRLLRRSRA